MMLGAVVTLVALIVLVPNARRLGLIDRPTERKRHDTPTPMVGGLAVFLGLATAISVDPIDDVFRSCWPRRFSCSRRDRRPGRDQRTARSMIQTAIIGFYSPPRSGLDLGEMQTIPAHPD